MTAERPDCDVVGLRRARGEALGRAVSSATEAASDCLTFELSCAWRQSPTGRGRTMFTVAWSGQAVAAVARQLERGVRHYLAPEQWRIRLLMQRPSLTCKARQQ